MDREKLVRRGSVLIWIGGLLVVGNIVFLYIKPLPEAIEDRCMMVLPALIGGVINYLGLFMSQYGKHGTIRKASYNILVGFLIIFTVIMFRLLTSG